MYVLKFDTNDTSSYVVDKLRKDLGEFIYVPSANDTIVVCDGQTRNLKIDGGYINSNNDGLGVYILKNNL